SDVGGGNERTMVENTPFHKTLTPACLLRQPRRNPTMKRTILLALSGCLAFTISSVRADNWPRFRGPNGEGVAADKNIAVQFDEKSGIRWKVALPGDGNSSPVIWDKHLFLQCAAADSGERMLVCLDATNGKPRWSRGIKGAKAKRTHPKNTPA